MKKLSIEELQVESFATSAHPAPRGTVGAFQVSSPSACNTWCQTGEYRVSCGADNCTDPGGGGGEGSHICSQTCATNCETCQNGATDCGTCAPAASCDLQYGCSGNSYDLQIC